MTLAEVLAQAERLAEVDEAEAYHFLRDVLADMLAA